MAGSGLRGATRHRTGAGRVELPALGRLPRFRRRRYASRRGHRVWVDNDWGLRYYLEADHGLPARKGQHVRPGDIVVTSELGHNVEFTAPLSRLAEPISSPRCPCD